jgi:hypothetical protein
MRWGFRHIVAIAAIAIISVAAVGCGSSSEPDPPAVVGNEVAQPGGHVHGSPPPPPAPLRQGERFVEVGLSRAYQPTPPTGGTDEYRCFLIDPKVTQPSFIMGSQFLPQNAEIVHHSILYRISPSDVERAKAMDAATDGDGWRCFGGTGIGGGLSSLSGSGSREAWISGWAPGGTELLLGERTGFQLEPGSQLVMQVHYNLLSTNGKAGPKDQSTVRLRVASGGAKVTPLQTLLLPGPIELPCTPQESGPLCDRDAALNDLVARTGIQAKAMVAGLNALCNRGRPPVPGVTQHCDIRVREGGTILSVAPHMHLLGRSISIVLNPGTTKAKTLLNQPNFNFDNQAAVPLAQPLKVNRGDTLRVTCTHDATLRSQLPELKPLAPRYVVWGDGTSDEMCLGVVVYTRV